MVLHLSSHRHSYFQEPESRPAHRTESREDQDLKTLLSAAQCGDLTILIANITEAMRKTVGDNFSPYSMRNKHITLHSRIAPEDGIIEPVSGPVVSDVAARERERKAFEERIKELSSQKVRELKASQLQFYDNWREVVLLRIGEVVNAKTETETWRNEERSNRRSAPPQLPPQLPPRPSQQLPPQLPPRMPPRRPVPAPPPRRPTGDDTNFQNTCPVAETGEQSPQLEDVYPSVKTPLTQLPIAKRVLILHSLLLTLISLEHYNALSRVLLLYLTSSLKLSIDVLEKDEEEVAKGLLEVAKQLSADEEAKKKAAANRKSRRWKVGLASVAGAAVIGLTGGLAAPLVAAGIGGIMGGLGLGATAAAGYLGAMAGSSVLVGSLFGAYGGRMTGKRMDSYARAVEDFAFVPIHESRKQEHGFFHRDSVETDHRLRVVICITGWLTEKEQITAPWKVIGQNSEVFALRWELQVLLNLGNSIETIIHSATWGCASSEIIRRTAFAGLTAAMWPLALLKISRVIDNPFSIAKSRADKAGKVLADALSNKAQGERPVTLIGYSLGARVIYSCLMSLAKRNAFGLVESAVLIGSPCPSNTSNWRTMRTAVSGRLVNVYSVNDSILRFLYRTSSVQHDVAGLQNVEGLPGVENVDVSELVSGHLRYRYLVGTILQKIGFEDVDSEQVKIEEVEYQTMLQDEKEHSYVQRAKQKGQNYIGKNKGKRSSEYYQAEPPPYEVIKDTDDEASQMEKRVQQKTQKSLMQ